MPHLFETAPTGRAKCRACGRTIARGERRFGERLPNPYAEGEAAEMTHWFHVRCAAFKRPESFVEALDALLEPLDDRDVLEREARLALAHPRVARVDGASRAPSARAACRACKEKIEKDAWRIALVWYEDGRFTPSGFVHPACAAPYFGTTELLPRLRHGSPDLDEEALAAIDELIRRSSPADSPG